MRYSQENLFYRRELQLSILLYLSTNGPSSRSEIYIHFEKQEDRASLSDAVRSLAGSKSIAMMSDDIITITASGTEQVQRPSD